MDTPLEFVNLRPMDKVIPSLRRGASWTLAASVVYAIAQWAMISAVAKLSSTIALGQFALGISIAAPVYMLTNLQLRGVQVTDARSEHNFADYFTLRCLGTVAGVMLILAIVVFAHYDKATSAVVLLVAIAKSVEQFSDVVAGLLQKFERLDQAAQTQMVRGAGSAIAFALVLFTSRSLVAAICASAATCAIVLLTYDFRLARRLLGGNGFLSSSHASLKRLMTVSLPLGLVTALAALNVNIPRYVVQHYLGPAQLGIFVSVAYVLVATVNVVVNSMGQSASARLAQMFAAGDLAGFNGVLRKLVFFGAAISLVGTPVALLCGRPLLSLIYRPEYAKYAPLLALMVGVAGVSAVGLILGFGVTATRRFRSQLPVISAATVAGFAVAVLLVPMRALFGAAFALLASAMVLILGNGAILAMAERRVRDRKCEVVRSSTRVQAEHEVALATILEKN
jgi:O-antigen/teichoic acid export membrane protein